MARIVEPVMEVWQRYKTSRLRMSAREGFSSGIVAQWTGRPKHSLDAASTMVVHLGQQARRASA